MDLGFVNVGAAVQQLPTNKASLTPETNGFGSFNVGAQIANLRALGAARTLTLVDGRRHIASTDTGNVDLNLIPPLLLDRTEIVTGGASAAYGSDAVAGVINVILDKDLEGVRWQADVYQSAEGDGTSRHVSAGGGTPLFGGRGHLIIGGEYEDAEGVDSCVLTRDWCRNLPGIVTNSTTPGIAIPGAPRNIITEDVVLGNMTSAGMIVGGATPLPTTSRLYGIQFDAGGNPIPFNYGAPRESQFVIGGDGFSRYETTNPRTPVERASIYTHLRFDLSDATTLFFETSFGMAEGHNLGAARWFNIGQAITINRRIHSFRHRSCPSWMGRPVRRTTSPRSGSASTGTIGDASRATPTTTFTASSSVRKATSTTLGAGTPTISSPTTAAISSCCASRSTRTSIER